MTPFKKSFSLIKYEFHYFEYSKTIKNKERETEREREIDRETNREREREIERKRE